MSPAPVEKQQPFTHAVDCDLDEDCSCMPRRRETLRNFLESDATSGFNLDEYERAEGDVLENDVFRRYVMLDDCGTYAWLNFSDQMEFAGGDSFEACVAVDLDTGEVYYPRILWEKSREGKNVNAPSPPATPKKKGSRRASR